MNGPVCITRKMAPLNVDGAICGEFWRGPTAKQTGRRDAKHRFSERSSNPFRATSGESLAEIFCYQIAIDKIILQLCFTKYFLERAFLLFHTVKNVDAFHKP